MNNFGFVFIIIFVYSVTLKFIIFFFWTIKFFNFIIRYSKSYWRRNIFIKVRTNKKTVIKIR
ncbi:270R [Invertebrate iridescent virus 6]|uniref:270R n=1 Tax=Invertebrate iridescent virus 6 TaxID=176652 RepID=Q91FQ3_IIV6|nr:270R [Invertebrate iridescent virus 6]AAK82131.1 270R [Invertebrate iridescent virus 6]QMS79379.1 hypothetical protein IIV6-T1_265 [Invertebrate iridescent virus 6]